LILHFNRLPDGTCYVLVMASGRNDMVPEQKNVVRGELALGGWRLCPVPGDPQKTRCDYLAVIDMKGQMPAFIMKAAMKD
jgi:hypothetical protein